MTPEQFLLFAAPLPEPMLLVSGNGLILAGNRATKDRLGPDLRGKRLADVVAEPPDEVAHYLRLCSRSRSMVLGALVLQGKDGGGMACRTEGTLLRPSTGESEALLMLRLLPKESAAGQFVALNRQIEELGREVQRRRRAEEAVRQQGERLRVTLHSIGDAVLVTDAEGRVLLLNPVAESLTGWTQDAAAGRPLEAVFQIVNESTRIPVENPALRALREAVVVGLANHTVLRARDGTERPIDDSAAPIHDEQGQTVGVVLVFRDVTERRARENALCTSEERLRLALEAGRMGVWEWNLRTDAVWWSDHLEAIHGLKLGTFAGTLEAFQQVPHPDDRELVCRAISQAVDARSDFDIEFRNVWPDGSVHWMAVKAKVFCDDDGQPVRMMGVSTDVTDRKRAEQELRDAEQRFKAVFNQQFQFMAILTPDGTMLEANDTCFQATGVARERTVGRLFWETPWWDRLPAMQEHWKRAVAEAVRSKGPVPGEVDYSMADGSVRHATAVVTPLKDEAGRVTSLVIEGRDDTDRKRAEAKLRESEEKFRLMADTIPQLAWMARPDGHIFWYNRRWYDYTGTTPTQMQGWGWQSVHDPETLPKVLERWRASLASGEPFDMVFPLRGADGQFRPFLSRVNPLRDDTGRIRYWFGTNTDISEQKRSTDAYRFLADASAALAAVVDYDSTLGKVARLAVPFFADWCAVDMAEPGGALRRLAAVHADPAKVRLANDLYRRYPPKPDDPYGPSQVLRTGQPEMAAEIPDTLLAAMAHNEDHLRLLRELGLRSYICAPLAARGKALGVLTFATSESGRCYSPADLTLAEDLAHRAAVAVENARLYAELRQADRLKDEFLAMLAHELRNSLAPVRNALEIMKMPGANSAIVGQMRDMAERQVQHMARLLDDLLDVSRISRGRIELRKAAVDMAAVFSRTVEAVRPLVEERRHELTVSLPAGALWLEADPTRLEQVLTNLLNNAAKYTDPGGHVWLTGEREGDEVVVRVQDTGIGIAPEMVPRIFDLFVQAERRLDRSQGGVGIGLTLVKKLVELHGGSIAAYSPGLGQGSQFVIRLPATSDVGGRGMTDNNADEAHRLPRRRVLVVDDNPDAADSLALLLGLAGQDVRAAYDGPSALGLAPEFNPDVVFLDIGMPGIDGYEVARRLRRQPGLENVLLIALTGWGQDSDRRRSAETGFDHHLVKPVEPKALNELLAVLKSRSR